MCIFRNGKNFNKNDSLKKVVLTYNNINYSTISTIKSKHVYIFYSKDKELFLKIKETTINSTKNYNDDNNNELINSNDYVLIYNNFEFNYIKKKAMLNILKNR